MWNIISFTPKSNGYACYTGAHDHRIVSVVFFAATLLYIRSSWSSKSISSLFAPTLLYITPSPSTSSILRPESSFLEHASHPLHQARLCKPPIPGLQSYAFQSQPDKKQYISRNFIMSTLQRECKGKENIIIWHNANNYHLKTKL